jgi:ketosteroid isomerase-like protein
MSAKDQFAGEPEVIRALFAAERGGEPEQWKMSATDHLAGKREVIRALFAAMDRADMRTVSSYLHEDVVVILSNQEPIRGADAFAKLYEQVTGTLAALRHELHDVWSAAEAPGVWIVRMTVHYTRSDGKTVSLPCCNVFRFADALVSEYQVFMDMTPVFA